MLLPNDLSTPRSAAPRCCRMCCTSGVRWRPGRCHPGTSHSSIGEARHCCGHGSVCSICSSAVLSLPVPHSCSCCGTSKQPGSALETHVCHLVVALRRVTDSVYRCRSVCYSLETWAASLSSAPASSAMPSSHPINPPILQHLQQLPTTTPTTSMDSGFVCGTAGWGFRNFLRITDWESEAQLRRFFYDGKIHLRCSIDHCE